MARRGKYGFDKRLKELKKKKKREEKLERKRMKKQGAQSHSEESRESPAEATDKGLTPDGAPEEVASTEGERKERENR